MWHTLNLHMSYGNALSIKLEKMYHNRYTLAPFERHLSYFLVSMCLLLLLESYKGDPVYIPLQIYVTLSKK